MKKAVIGAIIFTFAAALGALAMYVFIVLAFIGSR